MGCCLIKNHLPKHGSRELVRQESGSPELDRKELNSPELHIQEPGIQHPSPPTRNKLPLGTIYIGNLDVRLGEDINLGYKSYENIESKVVIDFPEENGHIPQNNRFIENRDTKYVKCTALDLQDALILEKPISKICYYFDSQYAIFLNNTDYFTTVDRDTLAINNVTQLQGSHSASKSIVVLDVDCYSIAKLNNGRHLYYACRDDGTGKTMVMLADGSLVTDKAKTCCMMWNDLKKMFDKKTNVIRPVLSVCDDGSLTILTDEGLAFYHITDIKAGRGKTIKPMSAIKLLEASHCIQAYDAYTIDGAFVYIVLTDKGIIKYVHHSFKGMTFELMHASSLHEGLTAKAVFSSVMHIEQSVVVAGFDVDKYSNMLIVLNDQGDRVAKLDAVANDDCMPIVGIVGYHYSELAITFLISHSITSVYVHCLNVENELTQIFDRMMDGLDINGVMINLVRYREYVNLMVYGQCGTRGAIVNMKLDWNADEIKKLN